jgi:hypothetical protein
MGPRFESRFVRGPLVAAERGRRDAGGPSMRFRSPTPNLSSSSRAAAVVSHE